MRLHWAPTTLNTRISTRSQTLRPGNLCCDYCSNELSCHPLHVDVAVWPLPAWRSKCSDANPVEQSSISAGWTACLVSRAYKARPSTDDLLVLQISQLVAPRWTSPSFFLITEPEKASQNSSHCDLSLLAQIGKSCCTALKLLASCSKIPV